MNLSDKEYEGMLTDIGAGRSLGAAEYDKVWNDATNRA